jgi:hypothetical protein
MRSLLAESPGDLVLEVLDGGPPGFDAGFAPSGSALPGRIALDAKWYIGNEPVAYGPQAR